MKKELMNADHCVNCGEENPVGTCSRAPSPGLGHAVLRAEPVTKVTAETQEQRDQRLWEAGYATAQDELRLYGPARVLGTRSAKGRSESIRAQVGVGTVGADAHQILLLGLPHYPAVILARTVPLETARREVADINGALEPSISEPGRGPTATDYDAGLATAEHIVRKLAKHNADLATSARDVRQLIAGALYDAADHIGSAVFTHPQQHPETPESST